MLKLYSSRQWKNTFTVPWCRSIDALLVTYRIHDIYCNVLLQVEKWNQTSFTYTMYEIVNAFVSDAGTHLIEMT
jgi:hypothetical protein